MIRVLIREVLLTLVVLATLAAAAGVLLLTSGPPAWPHWSLLLQGDRAVIGAVLRLAGYAVLGLCALVVLARLGAGWIVLRQLQIPVLTHVAELIHIHQVFAVAGALRLVLALFGGRDTAVASGTPIRASRTLHTLVHTPLLPFAKARQMGQDLSRQGRSVGPGAPMTRHRRMRPSRRAVGRVPAMHPSLLYTVQRGDTLSLIAERLYGDPAQYTRIFRASRGIRQDDGGMLDNPNLIRPGWRLRVPLPALHLSVSGDHALYVVQPGDSESLIAARFLGDWRRYVEIDHLSRGVRQPDGGMLENPNLIQPGWILRLPLDGRIEPALLPLHLKRHIVPRRVLRPHHQDTTPSERNAVPHAVRYAVPITPLIHPRHPEPPVSHTIHQRPLSHEPHDQYHLLRPIHAVRRLHLHHMPPAQAQHTSHRRVRPRRHMHPRRLHSGHDSRDGGIRPPVAVAHPAAPGTSSSPVRPPVAVPPIVRVPDSDRLLPLTLVLGLLGLCALVARRRAAGRLGRGAVRAGQRVVPSMRRALLAVQTGVQGLLEQRLRRAAVATRGHGNVVAHVVAALAAAGTQSGAPVNLARLTRRVTESQQAVSVLIEARRLGDDLLARLVAALQVTLGTPVQAERTSTSDGMPCVRLTLKRSGLTVSAEGWGPGQARPHPAPLLVPVGHADGTVLHLNLGRCGAALVAGGTQGANTLVATLVAGSVVQAHPHELRLLVASADDELRRILPVLDHLEAPPATAGDVAAMAALVNQAHAVVVERFTAGAEDPSGPAYLLVLDRVETLCADRRALDRLDVICRNGRLCNVHVLATTSDPALLEEEGLLASFPTRLLRRLGPEESVLLCGDARATALDARELLVQASSQAPEQVSLFTLTIPEVRDLCARLATLLAAEATAPRPVTTPPVNGPTPQASGGVVADAAPAASASLATPAPTPPADATTTTADRDGTAGPDATAAVADRSAEAASSAQPAAETGEGGAAQASAGSTVVDGPASEQTGADAAPPDGDGRQSAVEAVSRSQVVSKALPIAVTVFGQVSAAVGETEVELEGQHRRVLAALAVMGPRQVRAERLYNALFRDMPDEQANRLLITTVSALRHRLRKAAGLSKTHDADPILRDSVGYRLNPGLVNVDSYRFQDLLARSRADGAPPDERGRLLAEAMALYQGDLCGDEEMEWLIDKAPAWRRQYLEALAELATYYADVAGDLALAERTARRLVDEEPTVPSYAQLSMRVLAAQNDESGLEKAYGDYRRAVLALELDLDDADGRLVDPGDQSLIDAETQMLVDRLRNEIRKRRGCDNAASKAG